MKAPTEESMTSAPPARSTPAVAEVVTLALDGQSMQANLMLPADARGIVLLTLASGGMEENPRVEWLVGPLEERGVGALVFPLLTSDEASQDKQAGLGRFDLARLTHRLLQATQWTMREPRTRHLGIGYLGTGLGVAAALVAAAQLGYAVRAVVGCSGQLDGAVDWLSQVTAPTLLVVGEGDEAAVHSNRRAYERLRGRKHLTVVPAAGPSFEDSGALPHIGAQVADWFGAYLKPITRL